MTVYVDELKVHRNAWGPFKAGSCHLMADTLDELHAFAKRLGCKRSWFQDHPKHPHYDLVESFRERALALGAEFVPAMEQARRRMAAGAPAVVKPLSGEVTHPLSKHAISVLDDIKVAPVPTSEINPGVVNRLLRDGRVELVDLPSPFKRGGKAPHLRYKGLSRGTA